ncbi:leucine-rich repeat domain-containing protein [Pseudomonas sp. R5(2019)]|uniref:leucine-rich repeat domain-containing protein n=1 Tax=Pseudomonas sp. R5(2019) TaxID=2697566 RepID=UPI0014122C36|nr:leucine-rich repeat domain-containing protein [Pseudomonas sp. R5(2019)]NBA97944.1 hypothetical protein [Pseudomonas sp. R5(2019)]
MYNEDAPSPAVAALIGRFRALYPRATEQEASAAVHLWADPQSALSDLEAQRVRLRNELNTWNPTNPQARERIVDAWQWVSSRTLADGQMLVSLDFDDLQLTTEDLTSFPALSASMAHVRELSLAANPLTRLPEAFVRHFPNLQRLIVSDCELEAIPGGLNPALFLLDLSANRIEWNAQAQATLETYPQLTALVLSDNPLLTPPDLTRLPLLGGVDLANCSLSALPAGLALLQRAELIDLSSNQLTTLPVGFSVPPVVGQAMNLEDNPFTPDTLARIEHYYTTHGVDLLVAQTEYRLLLQNASEAQRASWQQLRQTTPLAFTQNLRHIVDTVDYRIAPDTTLRRFWRVLEHLNSNPALRGYAITHAEYSILVLEHAADIDRAMATSTPRLQTESLLAVVINRARCSEVFNAINTLVPDADEDTFEPLYQWTLQHMAADPAIPLPQAPTPDEAVYMDGAVDELSLLTTDWLDNLRVRLVNLTPDIDSGLDALLTRDHDDQYEFGFWVDRLRVRYAERFEALRASLDTQLEAAVQNLSEGELIVEAARLRDVFERDSNALIRALTREIWLGTVDQW